MSNLKDRMYNHEETPPANSWERIAAALEDSALQNKFPGRLYNFEVEPPAGVWQNISKSLEPEHRSIAPVRKLAPYFRYAAAAILIAAVIFGISKFGINKSSEDYATTSLPLIDSNRGTTRSGDSGNASATEEIQATPDNNVPVKHAAAKSGSVAGKPVRNNNRTVPVQNEEMDSELFHSIYAYADHVPDVADRYVMLMTPDGKLIRMSKKWSDLLCCVSGEEQDADCRNQIKKWQEKIAGSSLAPSPGNFMDILGLVNSLDESNGL